MKRLSSLRATAALVAGLLLASAIAVGSTGRCCPETKSVETVFRSLDCCATMLASPVSRPPAITQASDALRAAPAGVSLHIPAAVLSLARPAMHPTLSDVAVGDPGPPLFRLHAQLLI